MSGGAIAAIVLSVLAVPLLFFCVYVILKKRGKICKRKLQTTEFDSVANESTAKKQSRHIPNDSISPSVNVSVVNAVDGPDDDDNRQ